MQREPDQPTPRPNGETVPSGRAGPGGAGPPSEVVLSTGARPPASIGRYRVLNEIGRGGMGVVYRAVREEPGFTQAVAIKLIARERGDPERMRFERQRLEAERTVLSALAHPNIARLIDVGTTDEGSPFFVMEYIEGLPISVYCDRNRLNVDARLALFRKVCGAVHAVHQAGIVHRDIKPSNILVTGEGEPKLLDFGIAKFVNPVLSPIADATAAGFRLMTPRYASPEQIRGEPVSTLSDVYSLGVLLYELLTGHWPYRAATRLEHELVRIVCEEEPERPSTAIDRVEEAMAGDATTTEPGTVASTREGQPRRLRLRLRGEIDDILLKALEKPPTRRYSSAEQFADDIRRHLEGEPVIAHPPSAGYRLQKAVRRNRVLVGSGLAILVALSAGLATSAWQWRRAERRTVDARTAEQRALSANEQLWEVSKSLIGDVHGAIVSLPGAVEARQRLATISQKSLEKLEGASLDPARRVDLANAYARLGEAQGGGRTGNLGNLDAALAMQRKALEIRHALLDGQADNPDYRALVGESHLRLADVLSAKGDQPGAEAEADRAVSMLEAVDGPGKPQEKYRVRLVASLARKAELAAGRGDLAGAEALAARAQSLREELVRINPSDLNRRNLSVGLIDRGDHLVLVGRAPEALEPYRAAVAIRQELLDAAPNDARRRRDVALSLGKVATGLRQLGRGPEALEPATRSYDILLALVEEERAQGSRDARNLQSLAEAEARLASARAGAGQGDQALTLATSAVERLTALAQADQANVELRVLLADAQSGLGDALLVAGQPDAAGGRFAQGAEAALERLRAAPEDLLAAMIAGQARLGQSRTALVRALAEPAGSAARAELARQAIDAASHSLTLLERAGARGQSVLADARDVRAQAEALAAGR